MFNPIEKARQLLNPMAPGEVEDIAAERPGISLPEFCANCPVAPTCDRSRLVVARAGQRTPVSIEDAVYFQAQIPRHFVLAYDREDIHKEPVLLGEGPYGAAEAIALDAISKITACEGPNERRERFGVIHSSDCGAGRMRFSERYFELGYIDDFNVNDLENPGWLNILAPKEFRDELYKQYIESDRQEAQDLLFGSLFKNMGPDVTYRSITQAERAYRKNNQKD